MWPKPSDLHDRDAEWQRLCEFVDSPGPGTRLGLVYGRRRQGKTTLLEELCRLADGFYWQAREQEPAQNLESLSDAWMAWRPAGGPSRFASWSEALSTLASAGAGSSHAVPVVVDEVGYLFARAPSLPSELQAVLSPRGAAARRGGARLILCGSAFGQMRRLIGPTAPLRGRAALELVVQPFDYRAAAEFWGLRSNLDAAFRLHSLVGGTPAYLELAAGQAPERGDVDRWVMQKLLDPSSALFREGRLAVAEGGDLGDGQLYWGMLGAIAAGADRWSDLAAALGGKQGALSHALEVLVDAGWVERCSDPLRDRRTTFALTEPIVRFNRLIVEPFERRLRRGANAAAVWDDAQPIVRSRIYGPHLEEVAKQWCAHFAPVEVLGGEPDEVGSSDVAGVGQIDLVVVERTPAGGRQVVAVGEVKSGAEPPGGAVLARLDQIVDGLAAVRRDRRKWVLAPTVHRLVVARSNFTAELRRTARSRPDTKLIDLTTLYRGS